MERLVRRQSSGLTIAGLRKWGMAFLLAGAVSRAILQNGMLGMADGTSAQLMDLFTKNPDSMGIAAIALVLQALETCAAPIFCFLLVEGFLHTQNFRNYTLKILAVAAVTELPYNLAMSGKLLDFSGRNPVFALVLGLAMMHFYQIYSEKAAKNTLIKLAVSLAAFVWSGMLKIENGESIVVLVGLLWMCRNKPNLRILYGCCGAVACCVFSPFFMAAPMSMMAIHFYNGEPGEENEFLRFWEYPVLLALIGVAYIALF